MKNVFVFYSTEDYATALGWLSKPNLPGEMAMRQFTDPLSPDAIRYYRSFMIMNEIIDLIIER